MPETGKTRILLADEDALRRGGLAALLSGNPNFEVIGEAGDGGRALEVIRIDRPDVAVVDLNLPTIHGIELVRRVRAEALGTKIIVLAGTDDEEIVREVVRAGGDGYLLKNGPTRHLVDAISYVRDGGQYFSPQLQRDGRDRHLLEEPARTAPQAAPLDEGGEDIRNSRDSRGSASRRYRRPGRSFSDPAQFRDSIREESREDLNDHDYEVMSMMAEGIRPILDRLDEIDSRVAHMETGEEPIPQNPRGWLSTQFADTLGNPRTGSEVAVLGRNVQDLETRLPELIEQTVTKRFHQMANQLQQEIEETHVKALEGFVKNIQVKLVQRVSALEQDMSKQAQAMSQLRDYSQRTEDNLSRLISGVDRLAKELPQRLATNTEAPPEGPIYNPTPAPESRNTLPRQTRVRRSGGDRGVKMFWSFVLGLALLAGIAWAVSRFLAQPSGARTDTTGADSEKTKPLAGTDTKTKMQAAQEAADRKDYVTAESIYKQIVSAEPNNTEAIKALASVLYREDKLEESAAALDKLPKQ